MGFPAFERFGVAHIINFCQMIGFYVSSGGLFTFIVFSELAMQCFTVSIVPVLGESEMLEFCRRVAEGRVAVLSPVYAQTSRL